MKIVKPYKFMHYTYFFLRSIKARDNSDFNASYENIKKAGRYAGSNNAKYYLFKTYVCMLGAKDEEALNSIRKFCTAYFETQEYAQKIDLNISERIWIESFAEFLFHALTGKNFRVIGYQLNCGYYKLKSLDFDRVRSHYQRLFSDSLYEDVLDLQRQLDLNFPIK